MYWRLQSEVVSTIILFKICDLVKALRHELSFVATLVPGVLHGTARGVHSGPKTKKLKTRPGSVVVERSPGMREVGGSIPGRVKQKTLKFEVLLLCLALSRKELETVWPARSQINGLG